MISLNPDVSTCVSRLDTSISRELCDILLWTEEYYKFLPHFQIYSYIKLNLQIYSILYWFCLNERPACFLDAQWLHIC